MDKAKYKEIELKAQQYCASVLMDVHDFTSPQVRAFMHNRIEMLAHSLTAVLEVPGKVLQQDRVIATYPTTWRDAVKARLGWKHKRTEVRLSEHLLFPHVDIPPRGQLKHRLLYARSRTTFQP